MSKATWDDITRVEEKPPVPIGVSSKRDCPCLLVLAGSAMGEMYKLTRERTVIGRGQKAHVRMIDDGVSREHCEIVIQGDKAILHDLGSTNGTFCLGMRIDRHELEDGDKILVGAGTVLKFTYHDSLDEVFQRQMYESALRDDLTKVFNKKYFTDRIESEFAYSSRQKLSLALVTFDVDHFKEVNDTHGHPAGDYVLAELAATVQTVVRVEDVFARVGGEEFSIICRGADIVQGRIVAERVRQTVGNHLFVYDGKRIPITVSVGVAAIQDPRIQDAQGFVAAADHALYEAKRTGRDRVCLWR